ncbi:MAG TPA: hypothetical protein VKY36_03775 [Moheibacter sp.]|nr:hypothetical protein [Moheibacter sp.]
MFTENELNIIHEIEQKTGLEFQKEVNSGSLCFVNNNEDIRDEFKLTFTEKDFLDFLNFFKNDEIKIPEDALTFWELVKKGKNNSEN